MLVFTDGAATDLGTAVGDDNSTFSDLPPVYPVIVAEGGPARDLAIESTNASETAYEDTPVTILATVRALGYEGKTVALRLLDEKGKEEPHQSSGKETGSGQESLVRVGRLVRHERTVFPAQEGCHP